MRDQTWFTLVAGVAATLVVITGFAGLAFTAGGTVPARTVGSGPTVPTVYRNLTISYDPKVGDFVYSASQLFVPQGVRVIFSITNYDPSTAMLPSAMYDRVIGVSGGMMNVTTGASTISTSSLPLNDISHTFTVWSGAYHLNVPIPAASGMSSPVRVTFSMTFNVPGVFTFGCVAQCGGSGTMSTAPGMFGSLAVQ